MKKFLSIFMVSLLFVSQILTSGVKIKADDSFSVNVVVESYDKLVTEGTSTNSNAYQALTQLLNSKGIKFNPPTGYITSIDSINASTFKGWDGWMYTVNRNGKYMDTSSSAMDQFTLQNGDELIVYYGDFDTPLANKITFNPSIVEENKKFTMNFTYDHYDWNLSKQVDTPIVNAEVIIDDLSPMATDSNGTITFPYGLSKGKHTYKISGYNKDKLPTVVADRGTFTIDNVNSPNISYSSSSDSSLANADNTGLKLDIDSEIQTNQNNISTIGNEWAAVSERALGQKVNDSYIDSYHKMLSDGGIDYLLNTDIEKMIIGLTAAGYSPYNFEGTNLVERLYNNSKDSFMINDAIFGLIAYNYANIKDNYPINKQTLIDIILSKKISCTIGQQNIEGWTYGGNSIDPDMTGMAISALAPYYDSDSNVKQAIDNAVDSLSFIQNDSGYITGPFGVSSESISSTMLGLISVGVNPTAAKFTKTKGNLLQALESFKVVPDGYKHSLQDSKKDTLATEEAYRALAAYKNYLASGKKYNLYSSNINSEALPVYTEVKSTSITVSSNKTQPLSNTGSVVSIDSLLVLGFILFGFGGITLLSRKRFM